MHSPILAGGSRGATLLASHVRVAQLVQRSGRDGEGGRLGSNAQN
jgi:hypothetical protein